MNASASLEATVHNFSRSKPQPTAAEITRRIEKDNPLFMLDEAERLFFELLPFDYQAMHQHCGAAGMDLSALARQAKNHFNDLREIAELFRGE